MRWYFTYLAVVALLLVFSSEKDRGAIRVIFVAGVGSKLLTLSIHGIIAPWKLVFPASVEVLTILVLLHWARNRTGFLQVGLLVVAWGGHVLCWLDLVTGSNIVYDRYSLILGCVALGQIAACYDTFRHNWVALCDAVLRWTRPRDFSVSGADARILRPEGNPGLPPL